MIGANVAQTRRWAITFIREKRLALAMSGGGARGAYQAGVVKGLAEFCTEMGRPDAFTVITGVSAGAINASFLAARHESFAWSAQKLTDLWRHLNINQVFRTDLRSFSNIGWNLATDIITSGALGQKRANYLLDTTPLFQYLTDHIDFPNIRRNLESGLIDALALSATDYTTSTNITFVSSQKPYTDWKRMRRLSVPSDITLNHVCASAAIPLFFAPVAIDGQFFGDGCLRNTAPLSPAIHLHADSILVIGVQHTPQGGPEMPTHHNVPSIARILSVLLNSVLLDGVAIDVERLRRINHTLGLVPEAERQKSQLRTINCLHISPSENISAIAYEEYERLPRSIRYLVGGLGSKDDAGNLVSYLLFVPSYCERLTDLGYHDALARRDEIEQFIRHALSSDLASESVG
jgi:NTE family protein